MLLLGHELDKALASGSCGEVGAAGEDQLSGRS